MSAERVQEVMGSHNEEGGPRRDEDVEDRHDLCTICFDRVRNVIFWLCLHFGRCEECIERVERCPFFLVIFCVSYSIFSRANLLVFSLLHFQLAKLPFL